MAPKPKSRKAQLMTSKNEKLFIASKKLSCKSSTSQEKSCTAACDGIEVSDGETTDLFSLELMWCVQYIDALRIAKKSSPKHVEELQKAMNSLLNVKTPLIKKRQLMRVHCGDYREKMATEDKTSKIFDEPKLVRNPALPPKSLFIRIKSRSGCAPASEFTKNTSQDRLAYTATIRDKLCDNTSQDKLCDNTSQDKLCDNTSQDKLCDNTSQDKLCDNTSQDKLCDNTSQGKLCDNTSQEKLCDNTSQDKLCDNTSQDKLCDNTSQDKLCDNTCQDKLSENYFRCDCENEYPSDSQVKSFGKCVDSKNIGITNSFSSKLRDPFKFNFTVFN